MKHLFQVYTWALILLIFGSCAREETKVFSSIDEMVADAKLKTEFISAADFKTVLESGKKIYIIDCREESEYDSSCIKNAINVPRGLLEFQIGSKVDDRRGDVYLYCSDGKRSTLAASVLPKMKFANVKVIDGGFDNWVNQFPDLVQLHPAGETTKKKPAASSGGCGG